MNNMSINVQNNRLEIYRASHEHQYCIRLAGVSMYHMYYIDMHGILRTRMSVLSYGLKLFDTAEDACRFIRNGLNNKMRLTYSQLVKRERNWRVR